MVRHAPTSGYHAAKIALQTGEECGELFGGEGIPRRWGLGAEFARCSLVSVVAAFAHLATFIMRVRRWVGVSKMYRYVPLGSTPALNRTTYRPRRETPSTNRNTS